MKILIIGSNGYIGNRLCEDLVKEFDISGVDICWFNDANDVTIKVDYASLTIDFLSLFDVIILLAAHSSVKMCEGIVTSAFNNNVNNFIDLIVKLEFISKTKRIKFIYASSSSVYGDVGINSVNEEYNTFKPHNHYDITKYINDLYIQRTNLEYYGLRFGTVNGYSPIMRNDVMINSMTSSALDTNEIKLYIKDIMRPILGLDDLVNALRIIINCDVPKPGIYNLASFNKTAEQIAIEVSNITGANIKEYELDTVNIINNKMQTKCYNFSILSEKFKNEFNFEFKDTIKSITLSIINNYNKIKTTNRNSPISYGI